MSRDEAADRLASAAASLQEAMRLLSVTSERARAGVTCMPYDLLQIAVDRALAVTTCAHSAATVVEARSRGVRPEDDVPHTYDRCGPDPSSIVMYDDI